MPDHEFVPPRAATHPRLAHLGSYRRTLRVPLARVYENALDWARLPHVHAPDVDSLRCEAAGPWGWRVELVERHGGSCRVELRLNRALRRWTACVVEGPRAGTEIWTQVIDAQPDPHPYVEVVVDFFAPEHGVEDRARAGEQYARRFARWCDRDAAMMIELQRQLDRRIDAAPDPAGRSLELGALETLVLPLQVQLAGRDYVLARSDGDLVVFPRQCPHALGPLSAQSLSAGVITCPWHGYRFDARTGENLSGQTCRLEHRPWVSIRGDGCVTLTVDAK